jgi:winged helix-turn-helix protein
VLVGDRLGLYKELARGAVTSAELAQRTGTSERYVREWLGNQGASGYVQYDAANGKWSMTPEQALCLADPNGPVDVPVGRVMYGASSQICVPVSLARDGDAVQPCAGSAAVKLLRAGAQVSPQQHADAGAPAEECREQRPLDEAINRFHFRPERAVSIERDQIQRDADPDQRKHDP